MFGCILAVFLGSTPAVAQSSVTPTKPLTTPGLNQPLLVPPANTSKNPSGVTGLGPGPGGSIPGFSSVINPQPSTGGRDAESVPSAETRTPTRQRLWNPSNFRMNVDGFEKAATKPTKVDALKVKQSTKSDELGAARDYAKPPTKSKKSEGARFGTLGMGYTPDESSNEKSKYGTWGSGFTPDKSSGDKTKYGTWGSGFTPDKSSKDESKYGTYGPGYTPDKSSNEKYGTWGSGFTPDKSSSSKTKYGTWGSGFTPDKSSKDASKYGVWGSGFTPDNKKKTQPEYGGWYIDSVPVGEASGAPSGGTATKTGASTGTGTGTGTGGSTGGQSKTEKQDDKSESSQ
jgi:hypothetical protein